MHWQDARLPGDAPHPLPARADVRLCVPGGVRRRGIPARHAVHSLDVFRDTFALEGHSQAGSYGIQDCFRVVTDTLSADARYPLAAVSTFFVSLTEGSVRITWSLA